MTFLNQSTLANLSETFPGWWGGVQHGMGFAGLVAPMAQRLEISKFYLASSHSVDFITPWGSDPRIDNHIHYSGVSFSHDGYEYTRHAKLATLISEIRTKGLKHPTLRVCYMNASNAGANCCICEKCSRTITPLLVEGEDPKEYGFSIPIDRFIRNVKASFAKTQFIFAANTLFHWHDIQRAIKTVSYADSAVQSYIEWVRDLDFASYKAASQLRRKRLDPLARQLRRMPLLYSLVKRVYRFIA